MLLFQQSLPDEYADHIRRLAKRDSRNFKDEAAFLLRLKIDEELAKLPPDEALEQVA